MPLNAAERTILDLAKGAGFERLQALSDIAYAFGYSVGLKTQLSGRLFEAYLAEKHCCPCCGGDLHFLDRPGHSEPGTDLGCDKCGCEIQAKYNKGGPKMSARSMGGQACLEKFAKVGDDKVWIVIGDTSCAAWWRLDECTIVRNVRSFYRSSGLRRDVDGIEIIFPGRSE